MKKLLFSLVAFMLLGVACQTDGGIYGSSNEDLVEVTIGVGVPELATRSGETDMNSGLGAIDNFNFDGDEWGNYDVRYILEVYEVTEGKENLNTPIKKREVQTYDQYQETMFSLRLVPNRDYRFVVWADFVNEDSDADLHYNTADLKAITRNKAVVAMDECQDAYFIQRDIKLGDKGLNETLELKRPFGKIRVITTDYDEVNIGSEPAKVTVQFYNHKLLTSLNAVTGVASGETSDAKYTDYIEYTVAKDAPYTQGYDSEDQNMTLFADYILAADDTVGAQEVNFKMTIWGQDGREIRTHDFNTQIPLERNHLTTIVGNLLTLDNEFTIKIDDNFDGEYIRDWDDEAVKIEDGQWGYGELNANGNYEFAIDNGAENFTLIVPQSAVNQTSGKLSPVGKAEFVASEAELEKNTFTITNFMVDATRAAEAATVTSGTMRASNWNDGVHVQFDLYYSFDPEADPAEYKNIRFEFKGDALAKTALATPVVAAAAVENVITLSWAAIEGAGSYAITNGTEMPVFVEECEYTFTGEYATEYTLSVVAVPADEAKNYPSEAGTVEVTVEAPVVEPVETVLYLQPNANWRVDNARFAAYFFGNGEAWADMTLVEGETNIYAVTVPAGFENIIFCRMNPSATANNWTNRWNQTSDLKVPTDGTNLYTVAEGAWDKGEGSWSTYTPAAEPEGSNTAVAILVEDVTFNGEHPYDVTFNFTTGEEVTLRFTTGGKNYIRVGEWQANNWQEANYISEVKLNGGNPALSKCVVSYVNDEYTIEMAMYDWDNAKNVELTYVGAIEGLVAPETGEEAPDTGDGTEANPYVFTLDAMSESSYVSYDFSVTGLKFHLETNWTTGTKEGNYVFGDAIIPAEYCAVNNNTYGNVSKGGSVKITKNGDNWRIDMHVLYTGGEFYAYYEGPLKR